MSISLATWNVAESLGIAADNRSVRTTEALLSLGQDVVIVPDAYWIDNPLHKAAAETAAAALDRMEAEGYQAESVEYDDAWLWGGRFILALSRLPMKEPSKVWLGSRDSISFRLDDPLSDAEITFIGAHFSDRSEHERLEQAVDVARAFDLEKPTVLAGDLNTMPGSSTRARLMRSRPVRWLGRQLPQPPARHADEIKGARLTKLERLSAMASGKILAYLEDEGLYNTNRGQKPTVMYAGHALFQLDHILATTHLSSSNFRVHDDLPRNYWNVSDHLPISVTLET